MDYQISLTVNLFDLFLYHAIQISLPIPPVLLYLPRLRANGPFENSFRQEETSHAVSFHVLRCCPCCGCSRWTARLRALFQEGVL